jgi:hypothetical protein
MEEKESGQKRCLYCGRYFKPDNRVGERQKACKDRMCQTKRKKEAQKRWLGNNPGYFKGRYPEIKEWRKEHPDYQRRWRARQRAKRGEIQEEISPSKPILIIRLAIPAKLLKGEIQDEIRLVRQCGCGFFVAGGGMQDTRLDCIP